MLKRLEYIDFFEEGEYYDLPAELVGCWDTILRYQGHSTALDTYHNTYFVEEIFFETPVGWGGSETISFFIDDKIKLIEQIKTLDGEIVMQRRNPIATNVDNKYKYGIFNSQGSYITSCETLEEAKKEAQKMLTQEDEFYILQTICKVSPKPLDALIEEI